MQSKSLLDAIGVEHLQSARLKLDDKLGSGCHWAGGGSRSTVREVTRPVRRRRGGDTAGRGWPRRPRGTAGRAPSRAARRAGRCGRRRAPGRAARRARPSMPTRRRGRTRPPAVRASAAQPAPGPPVPAPAPAVHAALRLHPRPSCDLRLRISPTRELFLHANAEGLLPLSKSGGLPGTAKEPCPRGTILLTIRR